MAIAELPQSTQQMFQLPSFGTELVMPALMSTSDLVTGSPHVNNESNLKHIIPNHRGFSLQILPNAKPDKKYLCSICRLFLRDPVQNSCGHRSCRSCFEDFARRRETPICPSCKEENQTDEDSVLQPDQAFPDNGIKREFGSLEVVCPNPGCGWTGLFKLFQEHETSCTYQASKDRHDMDLKRIQHIVHDETLPLKARLQNVETLLETTKRAKLEADQNLRETQSRIRAIHYQLAEYSNTVHGVSRTNGVLDEAVQQVEKLGKQTATYEQVVGVLNQQMEKVFRVLEVMMRQAQQRQRAVKENEEHIKNMQTRIGAIERTLLLKDAALADMNIRLQYMELTSYDGTLLWKIADFKKRYQDAVSGKVTSFYSPCFFTSRHGYRMSARIYLNGDGMGKGTHISLYFVIMRGNYDELLPWPFHQKVTFMLLDQKRQEHIIDAFRPDPESNSFKRPTSDMNIASGCPMFMPKSQLDAEGHAYVKDDTMFLRIMVDTLSLQ